MILNSLVNHYEMLHESGNAPDFGWASVDVNLGILLDENGQVLNLIPLVTTVQMGKKQVEKSYKLTVPVPVVRTSGVSANFLCDNPAYILGVDLKGAKDKALEKFLAAKTLHLDLLSQATGSVAKAVRGFFETWDAQNAANHPLVLREIKMIEQGRNMVFMVNENQYAAEDEELQQIWNAFFLQQQAEDKQLCLVSGRNEPIARLHDKIKNLPGAQTSGASLISTNADAFVSYNLVDTMPGAPIGEYSAFAYVTALNRLLADREHRIDLGDTRLVYWTNQADDKASHIVGIGLMPQTDEGDDQVLKEVFEKVGQGLPIEGVLLEEPFYVLGLRPNAARISVALFLVSSFGDILKNISRHYDRLEIVRPSFDKREYLSPWAIMQEIVNPNSKNKIPNPQVMMGLMRSMLTDARYPYLLYQNVLLRVRAQQGDGKISRGRAALIKACLLQYLPEKERECITVALNTQSTNKPYILGRLFAVLEAAQESANPGLNATIKDRFFNAASATPAIAFPQVLKLFETHIKKIKKDKPGFAISYQKQVQDLLSNLDVEGSPFPKTLGLEDQGLFILGYYQQTQARYTKKEKEEA